MSSPPTLTSTIFEDSRLGKDVSAIVQNIIEHNPDKLELNLKTGLTNHKNLTLNKLVFETLAQITMRHTSLSCVEYDGKKYYETNSSWGGIEDKESFKRPDYDPNIECDDYTLNEYHSWGQFDRMINHHKEHLRELYGELIEPNHPSEVTYHLDAYQGGFDLNDIRDQYEEDDTFHIELAEQISKFKPENVILSGLEKITLRNNSGFNQDHRGSTHCRVYLEYEPKLELNLPITLLDFMKALYRLKSHKWDTWYELYSAVSIDHTYLSDELTLELSFDHGS